MRQLAVVVTALGVTALGLGGCGKAAAPSADEVSVVATTTMLGSVVGEVVSCAGGSTRTIMPVGADPHDFAPSSADVTAMVKADLVVANGLDLEEGLEDALANARRDGATVFEVADKVDPIPFAAEASEPGHDHDHASASASSPASGAPASGSPASDHHHEAGSLDPHFWLDAARMAKAARLVAAELGRITRDTATFERCGTQVADGLTALDTQVRGILNAVPADRRLLVTDHHAFGYFAQAYGFQVLGVVVPGGSTLAKPSSADLADLVRVVRERKVRALFTNTAVSPDLVTSVAREAGAQVAIVSLYVGSLGAKDSGAGTYRDMLRTDAERIAQALTR